MPYIPESKKQALISDFLTGSFSYGKLAVKYGVSRQSAYFLANPKKQAENAEKQPKKSKESNTKDCRTYRQKKKLLNSTLKN